MTAVQRYFLGTRNANPKFKSCREPRRARRRAFSAMCPRANSEVGRLRFAHPTSDRFYEFAVLDQRALLGRFKDWPRFAMRYDWLVCDLVRALGCAGILAYWV